MRLREDAKNYPVSILVSQLWVRMQRGPECGNQYRLSFLARGATEGLAYAGDELAYKPASPEKENNVDIMVWVQRNNDPVVFAEC